MTKRLKSDLGWSTVDRISIRGKDLPSEILGHLNLGDMAFLELTGRAPNPKESKIFNAMVVTLVEHGVTPSALVARLTYLGAPEALQGAVAAGLLGLGSVFVGSMEGVARILGDAVANGKDAKTVLAENRRMPGIGHPIHKPVDPRVPRLFAIAEETGFSGRYVELMKKVQATPEWKEYVERTSQSSVFVSGKDLEKMMTEDLERTRKIGLEQGWIQK
jgi:citrate synthase